MFQYDINAVHSTVQKLKDSSFIYSTLKYSKLKVDKNVESRYMEENHKEDKYVRPRNSRTKM